eukprot:g14956.t1 g14956   contig21:238224-239177(-)
MLSSVIIALLSSYILTVYGFVPSPVSLSHPSSSSLMAHHYDDTSPPSHQSSSFPWAHPPYIALLTEPDACDSDKRVEKSIQAITLATIDGGVDLVVVRVADVDCAETSTEATNTNRWTLLQSLAELKQTRQQENRNFLLIINNDVDLAIQALSKNIAIDGVHVKERNALLIPTIRQQLRDATTPSHTDHIIIGTSCHSVESASKSYQLSPRGPDYLFVGTCYLTQSHPEKSSADQLEGPRLPGEVKRTLHRLQRDTNSDVPPPIIFALGGIDEHKCEDPVVKYGADGVGVIRSVMQAEDPQRVVQSMKNAMQGTIKE